jgi:AcrR family transcriptional regulator
MTIGGVWKAGRVGTLSAKGHKLNRRGRETRQAVIDAAVRVLADGGAESVSANLVAKEAGVTWGTVQHQFGDTDGLWAAVLASMAGRSAPLLPIPSEVTDLLDRVTLIIDTIWDALDKPSFRAMVTLRAALPRRREDLEAEYPRTAAALAAWDARWEQACREAFTGFDVEPVRLGRVRAMLPGAVRGLFNEQYFSSFTDFDEARRGLADAITAYLS